MKNTSLLNKKSQLFRRRLMVWHQSKNNRKMPWKGVKDVYKIWLSEIILQQTRVEQGTAYYERILQTFPSVFDLAKAPEEAVMKLWEGLGYYSRCRNLHATAKHIVAEREGVFPDTYEELLSLKGVGQYTAAAIASFAYDIPKPVIDGNVIRVLSRIFGIKEAVDNLTGRRKIEQLAEACIETQDPAGYNQAIMDFGATVCKPANPLCSSCSMQKICFAYANGAAEQLPVLEKKIKKKDRWMVFFILRHKNKVALLQRKSGDIWAGLYDFPSMEFPTKSKWVLSQQEIKKEGIPFLKTTDPHRLIFNKSSYSQQLTHQRIYVKTIVVAIDRITDVAPPVQWTSIHELDQFAFPKIIKDIIRDEPLLMQH